MHIQSIKETAQAPKSCLVAERPDIWTRGLSLAMSLTGYTYRHLEDGKMQLYGGGDYSYSPPPPKTEKERIQEEVKRIEREIQDIDSTIAEYEEGIAKRNAAIEALKKRRAEKHEDLVKQKKLLGPCEIFVPEGAMEWLLHEVGHWLAATPEERRLTNYGLYPAIEYNPDRELQAWAFQEIVLSPFGHAHYFTSPTQRDGLRFDKSGPIEQRHFAHIEKRIVALRIDVEKWRALYREWIAWGASRGPFKAPWEMVQ